MAKDLTKPSIKILDNIEIRTKIVELYKSKDQKSINLWSNFLIDELKRIITFDNEIYIYINEGIEVNIKYRRDKVQTHDIREVGFKIQKFAKEETNLLHKAALRTIGHSISSAHMKEHAIVASDYYIKVINILFHNDMLKVSEARNLQLKLLEKC